MTPPPPEPRWHERPWVVALSTTIIGTLFGTWITKVSWWLLVAAIVAVAAVLLVARRRTRNVLGRRLQALFEQDQPLEESVTGWDIAALGAALLLVIAAGHFAARAIEHVT